MLNQVLPLSLEDASKCHKYYAWRVIDGFRQQNLALLMAFAREYYEGWVAVPLKNIVTMDSQGIASGATLLAQIMVSQMIAVVVAGLLVAAVLR
jgi:hypothetical protein